MKLNNMTLTQLKRLEGNVWKRMTAGDGYQPFGYDAVTLRLTRPIWYALLLRVREAIIDKNYRQKQPKKGTTP